jgi:hypothetical protein
MVNSSKDLMKFRKSSDVLYDCPGKTYYKGEVYADLTSEVKRVREIIGLFGKCRVSYDVRTAWHDLLDQSNNRLLKIRQLEEQVEEQRRELEYLKKRHVTIKT